VGLFVDYVKTVKNKNNKDWRNVSRALWATLEGARVHFVEREREANDELDDPVSHACVDGCVWPVSK